MKRDNPEGRTQLQILHILKMKGFEVGKIKVKGSMYKGRFIKDRWIFLGVPDLVCFTPREMYFIECKSAVGVQSEHQKIFQQLCERTNVKYILAKCIEDIEVIK